MNLEGARAIELLLAYYGDDFTGSTDVLEALSTAGIEAALFIEPPSDAMLRRYGHARAFGVAGNSRTMSPAEMERFLPEAFDSLREREPRFVHYKVCSTFDSSPKIGCIGRAIDISHRLFQNRNTAGRRRADTGPLLCVRQSICQVGSEQRTVSVGSSSDDAMPSCDSDERSRSALTSFEANLAAYYFD